MQCKVSTCKSAGKEGSSFGPEKVFMNTDDVSPRESVSEVAGILTYTGPVIYLYMCQ